MKDKNYVLNLSRIDLLHKYVDKPLNEIKISDFNQFNYKRIKTHKGIVIFWDTNQQFKYIKRN